MNVVLWVVQVLLGLAFVLSGYSHGVRYETSKQVMVWLAAVPRRAMLLLAALEALAGIGLVLPGLIGVAVWLTPVAAVCLAVVMVFAIVFHVARHEMPNIGLNAVLGILAAFVAYGRIILAPF